ncbi:MAG: hypothetical protein KDA51_09230 [Planctomycetales bacterium]|nr:hypothetical protein [Planctomycetales bacterium]
MKILAIPLLVVATAATATKVVGVSLDRLYAESSSVVSGVIESGQVLANGCGVAYKIRVDENFKGTAKSGDVLTVEKYGPTQIGARYFLFLSPTEEEFQPIMSTNSGDMARRAEYINRCKSVRPGYTVNIWGNGALKVTGTYHDSLEDAVIFDDYLVKPPEQLEVTALKPSERYDNDQKLTAMELHAFSQHLRELYRSSEANN